MLNVEVTQGKSPWPAISQPQLFEAIIRLTPNATITQTTQLNLCLVLDTSGSMGGDKIDNVKEASKMVVDMMNPGDYLSIIAFSLRPTVITPCQQIKDRESVRIKSAIDSIYAGGSTNMADGLAVGLEEVKKALGKGNSQIILLTDGHADEQDATFVMARMSHQVEVPIACMGVGRDWDEEFLTEIAKITGGICDWIDDPSKVNKIFQRQVQDMQATMIAKSQLTIKVSAGFEIKQLWRFKPAIEQLEPARLSDREFSFQTSSIDKDGMILYLKGQLPSRPAGEFRMASCTINGDGFSENFEIIANFQPGIEPINNATVADYAGLAMMMDLQKRGTEAAKAGDSVKATTLMTNALERGTRLLATGFLGASGQDVVNGLAEEVKALQKGGAMTAEGGKKILMTSRLTFGG